MQGVINPLNSQYQSLRFDMPLSHSQYQSLRFDMPPNVFAESLRFHAHTFCRHINVYTSSISKVHFRNFFCINISIARYYQYMPPMPPPAGIGGTSSLILATADSVVRKVDATDVAFCNAERVTLAGSRIPALTISTYSSL